MNQELIGAEIARLFMGLLHDFSPHGTVDTWRWLHARRTIVELQACWTRNLRKEGVAPSAALWNIIVESGYRRAIKELEPWSWSESQEQVWLEDKIEFWRAQIPEAVGQPGVHNFLLEQQQVQIASIGLLAQPGELLYGDLVAWRQNDLLDWNLERPGAWPFAVDEETEGQM